MARKRIWVDEDVLAELDKLAPLVPHEKHEQIRSRTPVIRHLLQTHRERHGAEVQHQI